MNLTQNSLPHLLHVSSSLDQAKGRLGGVTGLFMAKQSKCRFGSITGFLEIGRSVKPGRFFVLVNFGLAESIFDQVPLVLRQLVCVDHVVQHDFENLVQVGGGHVEADGAVEEHAPQLKERVEREGGHVRLGPAASALLHLFFKLDPPF